MEREYSFGRRSDDGSISLGERLDRIEFRQNEHTKNMQKLEGRINYLFGGLAVLVTIVNIIGPIIDSLIKVKP